jgi:bla regulator protein blaR1
LAALLCIVSFNSVLIINEKQGMDTTLAYDRITSPFNFFSEEQNNQSHSITPASPYRNGDRVASAPAAEVNPPSIDNPVNYYYEAPVTVPNEFIVQAAQDDIDASLTKEQKDEIKSTVANTKKIFTALQWKEMDKNIADALTTLEKQRVRQQYMTEVQQSADFKNLEQNLKAKYEKLDWEKINDNMNQVLVKITLDSLQHVYTATIAQLDKIQTQVCANATVSVSPMPDQSIEDIEKSKLVLQKKVECIKAVKNPKRIVKL